MDLAQIIKLINAGAQMAEAVTEFLDTRRGAQTMSDPELEAALARFATANDQLAQRTQAKLRG